MQKVLKSPGNERLLITALQYPRDGKVRIVWIPGRVVVIMHSAAIETATKQASTDEIMGFKIKVSLAIVVVK